MKKLQIATQHTTARPIFGLNIDACLLSLWKELRRYSILVLICSLFVLIDMQPAFADSVTRNGQAK